MGAINKIDLKSHIKDMLARAASMKSEAMIQNQKALLLEAQALELANKFEIDINNKEDK